MDNVYLFELNKMFFISPKEIFLVFNLYSKSLAIFEISYVFTLRIDLPYN